MTLEDATLDDILSEISARYSWAGGLSGTAVIVAENNILVTSLATQPQLLEMIRALYSVYRVELEAEQPK